MTFLEAAIAVLMTPLAALAIAWWVLRDDRRVGEAVGHAQRRSERDL